MSIGTVVSNREERCSELCPLPICLAKPALDSFGEDGTRTVPQTPRSFRVADENVAEQSMLCGYGDDLAKQVTATSNRIRGLLTKDHPGLDSVVGPHLDHPAMLAVLAKYLTPKALRHAGKRRAETLLRKQAPRPRKRWAATTFTALDG